MSIKTGKTWTRDEDKILLESYGKLKDENTGLNQVLAFVAKETGRTFASVELRYYTIRTIAQNLKNFRTELPECVEKLETEKRSSRPKYKKYNKKQVVIKSTLNDNDKYIQWVLAVIPTAILLIYIFVKG